ncbi:MAG: hypothetical protein B9S32_14645 [Verrucomicrobia bacterium Tous-C9LFEB]|nr:MAG: hypothetical protein B9S32_14645 [Verrucomicrobia bacterium Tous-C9LFEB]
MGLFFSQPAVAWFLPAIALPVLFHLFFRLRRQVREFPSLMFFMRIDPKLSAKRKIHEWLILFLRCLFIALVVLALMRPRLEVGSGGSVARVVLIDNSASMAAVGADGNPKLTVAARVAEKIATSAQAGDATAVQLMISDSQAGVPGGFNPDTAALREALSKLEPTDGSANVAKSIRAAFALLSSAKQPVRELHVVTDLQKTHWSRGEVETPPENVRVVVHRIETPALTSGSVSLEMAPLPNRALPTGRAIAVKAALRNHGPKTALVRINTTDDAGKNFSRDISIPAGESVPIGLTFSFASTGFHWARIWIEGDVAPSATRADLGFWCSGVQRALFVGSRERFGALPFAVAPGGNAELSGIEAVAVSADRLVAELAAKPLAVAITWDDWPQDGAAVKALETYVRQGGTLFLIAAPEFGTTVARPVAAWVGAGAEALRQMKESESLVALQADAPVWRDLRDAEGKPKLGTLKAFAYRPLKLEKSWQPLLASVGGATVLAQRPLDKGWIYASGMALTSKWSSLPLKPGFVVLMQNLVFGERTETIPVEGLAAGELIPFNFPKESATVRSLAGSALQWQGKPEDFGGLARCGVYEIQQKDKTRWVALHSVADEAAPEYLSRRSVPLLKNVPHDVVALSGEENASPEGIVGRSSRPLMGVLLALALVVLLAETWLANERGSDFGRKLFDSLLPSAMKRKAMRKTQPAVTR